MSRLKVTSYIIEGEKNDDHFIIARLFSVEKREEIKPHKIIKASKEATSWKSLWYLTPGEYIVYHEILTFDVDGLAKSGAADVQKISVVDTGRNDLKISEVEITRGDFDFLLPLLKGKQRKMIESALEMRFPSNNKE